MQMAGLRTAERPREKLQRYGPSKLTDAELLALLLNFGTKKKGVLELSSSILKKWTIEDFRTIRFIELTSFYGISVAKACTLLSAIEFGRRLFQPCIEFTVTSPKSIFDRLFEYVDVKKEHLLGLYLNVKNVLLKTEIISIGTVNESLIHPREIFEPAIRLLASGFLVVHNHPSNDPNPSREDIDSTVVLYELSKMMGIKLHDHIIIAKSGYFSFKEHGLL